MRLIKELCAEVAGELGGSEVRDLRAPPTLDAEFVKVTPNGSHER